MSNVILVTNDDGYDAPGIRALVEVAKDYGDVVVVAPDRSWSAKSHAVTLEQPVWLKPTDFFGKGVEAYITSGTPVDCVKLALNEILEEKPKLVLSGINHGANHSVNLFYSGTVAAAIEAAFNQIPAIASSVTSFDRNIDLSLAKKYTSELIELVLEHPLQNQMCLNLNVPDINASQAKGLRFCRQARAVWQEEFVPWEHPVSKQKYYWLTGKFYNFEPDSVDTDLWALNNGYASVVPINVDLSNYAILNKLKNLGVN